MWRRAMLGAGAVLLFFSVIAVYGAARVDATATAPISGLERAVARWMLERAVQRAPPSDAPPLLPSREGIARFDQLCRACHGVPGGPPGELGRGLNPAPPDLSRPQTQARTDAQLYWIISRGVRMSGMPAFAPILTDQDRWQQVAFVRHLRQLSAEERALLGGGGEVAGERR